MTKSRMRATHQIQPFRIRRPVFEKLIERRACIFKLSCRDVSRRYFAPNLVLRVGGISRDDVFEVLNSVRVSLLLPRNPSELVTRVNLFRIDL